MSKQNMNDFIESFIESKKITVERGTWKVINTFNNHFQKYQSIHGIVNFEDIDSKFLTSFTKYLYEKNNHSKNYAAKMIEICRQVTYDAYLENVHQNQYPQSKRFRIAKEPVHDIALSTDEIQKIANVNVNSLSIGEQVTRDFFILACWTGLRHSDWFNFQRVKCGQDFLTVQMIKTKGVVLIPLNPICIKIMERYNYQMPKPACNQVDNRNLKRIAELAELFDTEIKVQTKGGNKTQSILKRCEMIGTHTARRTFVTNAFLSGMDTTLIRSVTGHSSEAALMKYLKLSLGQRQMILKRHPFFA